MTFEDHLPSGPAIERVFSDLMPDLPAQVRWNTPGYDWYVFLPKEVSFTAHIFMSLEYHKPQLVSHNGRWFIDSTTVDLWKSLDSQFTKSIKALGNYLYFELDHREPNRAVAYGFMHGYRSKDRLLHSLRHSKHAFIHRMAYLTYLVALRYKWDTPELGNQLWRSEFVASCGANWVDSV